MRNVQGICIVKKILLYYTEQLYSRVIRRYIMKYIGEAKYYDDDRIIYRHNLVAYQQINSFIYNKVMVGEPFMVSRFGSTELYTIGTHETGFRKKIRVADKMLCKYSGFFSSSDLEEQCDKFYRLMLSIIPEIDVLGIWMMPFEHYFSNTYLKKGAILSGIRALEPWNVSKPWTAALKGKKVLVIHPFSQTIKRQFEKRDLLFPDTNILPEFTLYTLKAIQTIADEVDTNYETWFDALEYMYNEAMKITFDIAIIGCGAYGMPLAAKIKRAGRQAIHMGGVTQILFGIKGKRWDDDPVVSKLYNEYWARPKADECPKGANAVEGGCYW